MTQRYAGATGDPRRDCGSGRAFPIPPTPASFGGDRAFASRFATGAPLPLPAPPPPSAWRRRAPATPPVWPARPFIELPGRTM